MTAAQAKTGPNDDASVHPLDRAPVNNRHRIFVLIIALAAFFDFFDLMLGGAVAAALLASKWSTLQLNAIFLSVTGVGGIISNLTSGFLADRYGRRRIFRFALLLVGSATCLAALSPSIYWLIGFRFVAALGMAAVPALGWTMIAEILPASMRGRWSSLAGFIGQLAIFASAIAAYLLIPDGGWRWMFAIPGIGCILVGMVAGFLPESPRWLETKGRHDAARAAMQAMQVDPGPGSHIAAQANDSAARTAHLFRKPLGKHLLLAIILAVGGNVAMTAFLTWLPTLMLDRGMSLGHSLRANHAISAGSPIGAFSAILIADRIGRRRGLVGAGAVSVILAIAFAFVSGPLMLLTGFLFLIAMGLLLAIIMGLYLPELFPTEYRARATAMSMASVRLASVFLPFALLQVLQSFGVIGAMALIGLFLSAIVIAVPLLGPETAAKPLDRVT